MEYTGILPHCAETQGHGTCTSFYVELYWQPEASTVSRFGDLEALGHVTLLQSGKLQGSHKAGTKLVGGAS